MSLPWRHFVPESSRGGMWGSAAGPKLHQLRVFSPGRNTKRTFILNQQFVSRNPEPVCMSLTCSGPDRWTQFFSPVDILFVRLEMRLQWGKETEPSRTDPVSADDGFTATEWEDEAGSVGSGVFVPESRRQLRTRWVLTGSVTLHQFVVRSLFVEVQNVVKCGFFSSGEFKVSVVWIWWTLNEPQLIWCQTSSVYCDSDPVSEKLNQWKPQNVIRINHC